MARDAGEGPDDVLTVMLIPGHAGNVRRFTLRRKLIRIVGGVLVGFAVLFLGLSVDYVRVRSLNSDLADLQGEVLEQRAQIEAYAERMGGLAESLRRVGRFDRKLRVIADLDPADPFPLPGVGGVDGEFLEPHQLVSLGSQRRHERMLEGLDQLSEAARSEEASLGELIRHLENQTAQLAATPSVTPTKGWVTSGFGYRSSPFTRNREFHRGIDIAGRVGTSVVAPADGRVRFAGSKRSLGNSIVLEHGYGIESLYGHLSELGVKVGQRVRRGEQIGAMGSTGRSTGPHLHYQVEVNGAPVNPRNYILD